MLSTPAPVVVVMQYELELRRDKRYGNAEGSLDWALATSFYGFTFPYLVEKSKKMLHRITNKRG